MSEINPKFIKSIKIHKWNCIKCKLTWFLRVDERKEFDLKRLGKYETAISNHVYIEQHEVKHTEKKEFQFRYV